MIWLAWFILAVESLVIGLSLWMMWVRIAEASREPANPFSQVDHPPEQPLKYPPEARDDSARFTLEEVDERGYVSSRKLHMGCEAAVCRTPFGAKIVAGRRSLKELQYAWDYASVGLAEKALIYAEFNSLPREGIIGVVADHEGILRASVEDFAVSLRRTLRVFEEYLAFREQEQWERM
jgi:hypothetical protein